MICFIIIVINMIAFPVLQAMIEQQQRRLNKLRKVANLKARASPSTTSPLSLYIYIYIYLFIYLFIYIYMFIYIYIYIHT